MKIRSTKKEQLACQYAVVGESKTMPNQSLDVHTIVTSFTGPSFIQF